MAQLQGSSLDQPAAQNTVLGGPSNASFQNPGDSSILQSEVQAITVVGEKQPEVSSFSTADIALGLVLVVALGALIYLWLPTLLQEK
jgi:hypothetical protein